MLGYYMKKHQELPTCGNVFTKMVIFATNNSRRWYFLRRFAPDFVPDSFKNTI